MRRRRLLIPMLAIGLAVLAGAGAYLSRSARNPQPERFVLIVIDSLRADHLGCYGSHKGLTPNIDALAAESVRFDNAFSASSYTGASNAALFTGKYPHEVRDPQRPWRIADSATTLAECFRRAGFLTAAFSAHCMISTDGNFTQGFDVFLQASRQDDAIVTRCCNWLNRHQGRKSFVLLYLWNPHLPYRPKRISPDLQAQLATVRPSVRTGRVPLAAGVRRPRITENPTAENECSRAEIEALHGLYDGAVRDADERVQRVLRQLGDDPRTVVAVLADHGEEWLDHDGLRHMLTLYRELLHIPFIIRAPGAAPRVVEAPVSNLDLLPTVLALARIPSPPGIRGQRVLGDFEPRPAFSECGYWKSHVMHRWAVRAGDETVIYSVHDAIGEPPIPAGGIWERYDLALDPGQHTPLEVDRQSDPLCASLQDYYEQAQKRIEPYRRTPTKAMDKDLLEKLRALGYVAE